MDTMSKVAQQRLSVLELAAELGSVAEACRRRGMDRTSFYEWKRQSQTRSFAGLKDLPPLQKTHPQAHAAGGRGPLAGAGAGAPGLWL